MKKKFYQSPRKMLILGLAVFFGLLLVSVVVVRQSYHNNLLPVSSDKVGISFTVQSGAGVSDIANDLRGKGLIKSDWAFEWYIRNNQLGDQIKAGTYLLNPSMGVEKIADILVEGKVATNLVTILPGQRLDQIRQNLIDNGFSARDVDIALRPTQYAQHPALTDKPPEASLEGYLYPESFQKVAETTPQQIIRQSLDEMQYHLTPEIREAFNQAGLTVYEGIILASIVEQEVSEGADRAKVAQVFLKRLDMRMRLGADPTAFYGAALEGAPRSINYDSPYNTRLHTGLPPGPIGNVSASSLEAVAFPAQTDWLYFVSGDDGITRFSKTLEEHEELTRKYCKRLCSY